MSIDIAVTEVIERPIDVVSAYAGDPSNAPEWSRRVERADWQTDPPTRLGSRLSVRARLLGRPFDEVHEVSEWTPGEQVATRVVEGPFPITTVSTWRPVGDRVTHMTLHASGRLDGFKVLVGPILAARLRGSMADDLARLKQLLER